VDYKKPTRLLSDIAAFSDFGHSGWPKTDAAGFYCGPLPRECGHRHGRPMIGTNEKGGFHTSPTAAYPPPMCSFIAERIFNDWRQSLSARPPVGMGKPAGKPLLTPGATTHHNNHDHPHLCLHLLLL
jgi:hypothetical protein